jgi:hypothetical protein
MSEAFDLKRHAEHRAAVGVLASVHTASPLTLFGFGAGALFTLSIAVLMIWVAITRPHDGLLIKLGMSALFFFASGFLLKLLIAVAPMTVYVGDLGLCVVRLGVVTQVPWGQVLRAEAGIVTRPRGVLGIGGHERVVNAITLHLRDGRHVALNDALGQFSRVVGAVERATGTVFSDSR